jgi:hypothetical protein
VIRVLGYVTGTLHGDPEALAATCDARGWTMLKLVKETKPQLPGLVHRPHLMYALEELRFGTADGLVVAHPSDLTTDFADLVTVIRWVTGAGRFLAAADHPLDTSTEHGRSTAQALLGLGHWQRNRAIGRFGRSRRLEKGSASPASPPHRATTAGTRRRFEPSSTPTTLDRPRRRAPYNHLCLLIAERIKSDVASAMKAGERDRVTALRLVLSELQKDAKEGAGDELAVLRRERKRRREAEQAYRDAASSRSRRPTRPRRSRRTSRPSSPTPSSTSWSGRRWRRPGRRGRGTWGRRSST